MTDEPDIHDKLEVVSSTTRKALNAGFGCGLTLLIFLVWITGIGIIEVYYRYYNNLRSPISLEVSIVEFSFTLLFSLLAWLLIDRRTMFKEVGLRLTKWSAPDWIYGLLFGGFGVGVAILTIHIFGDISIVSQRVRLAGSETIGPWSWQVSALLFIFYAGEEEVFMRGLMYPLMRRYLGIVWAIIISSIIFCLLHIANPEISTLAMVDLFLAGVLFALLREYTGNLWLAWGVHFGWNFTLVATGLPVSGITVVLVPHDLFLWIGGEDYLTGGAFGPEGGLSGIAADLIMIIIVIALMILKKNKQRAQSRIQTEDAPALP